MCQYIVLIFNFFSDFRAHTYLEEGDILDDKSVSVVLILQYSCAHFRSGPYLYPPRQKRSFYKAWFVPIFFLFAIFFCRSSETRPPEDDEEEEEEILGSDDDEQEDPKDYVKGKNIIFRLNFTHYPL